MKTFLQFLLERRWHGGSDIKPTFDTSVDLESMSDDEKQHQPIWIGHHKGDTKRKYYKPDRPHSHFNKVQIHGKVAHYKDPKIHKLLKKYGYDEHSRKDYHDHLSEHPNAKTVHNHPITKILQKHGYVGYTHPDTEDYDELIHKKTGEISHVPNTVIFHRKHVTLTPVQHTKKLKTIEHLHKIKDKNYHNVPKYKFAHMDNGKIIGDLYDNGYDLGDLNDYEHILKHPHEVTHQRLHNHPITKALKKMGYHGAIATEDYNRKHGNLKYHHVAFHSRYLKA